MNYGRRSSSTLRHERIYHHEEDTRVLQKFCAERMAVQQMRNGSGQILSQDLMKTAGQLNVSSH